METDPRYEFYRYRDLEKARIVKSRFDLHHKIKDRDFPKPLKDGGNMQSAAFWRKSAVHAWLDRNHPQGSADRQKAAAQSAHPGGEAA